MIATKTGRRARYPHLRVPDYLIYEIMDGQPIHYKGYREVVDGTKKKSDIMGSSKLQAFIVTYLIILLGKLLDDSKYTILSSEAGIHLDRRNNLAGDILIFDSKSLPIEAIDDHYADVPPKVAIEVDIWADPSDIHPDDYFFKKTQKLLDFGVEKVIWIMTRSKKISVATPDAPWQVLDWHENVELLEGVVCNVGKYLAEKGSSLA